MTEYRGIGFDPTPGNADQVLAAAGQLRKAATACDAGDLVTAAGRDLRGWQGRAADAARSNLDGVGGRLTAIRRVLTLGADILTEWASTLLAGVREAEQLDRQLLEVTRQLDEAVEAAEQADMEARFAGSAQLRARRDDLMAQVHRLEASVHQIRQRAHDLADDHRRQAARTTARLRALSGAASGAQPNVVSSRKDDYAGIVSVLADHSALGRDMAGAVFGSSRGLIGDVPTGASAFGAAVAGR